MKSHLYHLLSLLCVGLTNAAVVEQPNPVNYGLARISHRARNFTAYRYDSSAGSGVCAYVLDSGILARTEEFQGRVIKLPNSNFVNGETHDDLAGHGTHVAGILGSTTYGVAKKITIFDVKVMNAAGNIDPDSLGDALFFVRADSQSLPRRLQCPKGFVVNLSIGLNLENATPQTIASAQAVNDNLQVLISQTTPPLAVFVAAGNENHRVSLTSPANLPDACTIGALDKNDNIFRGLPKNGNLHTGASNFGPGVDLWAPGTPIISTTNEIGDFGNFSTYAAGTSQACPFAAGVAAVRLSSGSSTSRSTTQMCNELIGLSTKGAIQNLFDLQFLGQLNNNRILFNGIS